MTRSFPPDVDVVINLTAGMGGDVVFGDGSLDVSAGIVHVKIPASTGAVFAIMQ